MLQKRTKRALSLVAAFALVCTGAGTLGTDNVQAAKKATLKTKKMTVKVGKTKKITVKGKKKKAKYTFKSNKRKIATVSKKGVVKGIKKGKAVITVKEIIKKKKRTVGKVKVTVKKAGKVQTSKTPAVTSTPVVTPPSTSGGPGTNAPTASATPTGAPTPTPASTADVLRLEGDQLKPTEEETRATYTLNDDGSVTVPAGWKYYAISLGDEPLNLAKVKAIEIEGSASAGYRLIFGNKETGEYYFNPDNLDDWIYPNAFTGSQKNDLTEKNPYGQAHWLFLGTKGTDEVTFNISSITITLGEPTAGEVNTDGLTQALKETGKNNPIAAQRFMADPYAIEYEGRVYVYGTNDSQSMQIGESGSIPNNSYSNINTLNCYSSTDMVNWRDEGIIQAAGKKGPASWAKNSWAPAVCYKNIDGKDKFFIYFADSGRGIGVLEGDSPTGPWRDPIGTQLIGRDTPNCGGNEVPWLFDPAVLVDDDGQGYLYFGGIGDVEDREHPKCIRVVKLGDDMISLAGEPQVIDAPAPFEDSGINKIGDKYYYSYCTNWDGAVKRPNTSHLGTANIAYMVSDSPMGPWSEAKVVLKNPTSYFTGMPNNDKNNNHHCMFMKDGKLYMFYHSQKMAADMGITQGYRTTGVDLVTIDENGDLTGTMTEEGVAQVGSFNPYEVVEAETFAWSEGTSTIVGPEQKGTRNNRVLSSIDKRDYVGLSGVDFGSEGAQSVMMRIASASKEKVEGTVSVYIDSMTTSKKVGEITISADEEYKYMSAQLTKKVTGKHKLYFRFNVGGILVDTWMFSKDAEPKEPVEEEEPAPEPIEGALINLSGDALKPVEGVGEFSTGIKGVTVPGGWKYCAIDLGETVDLSKVASIKINGSASEQFRMSFRGEDVNAWEFFIDEDKTEAEDAWKMVPAQTDTVTDVEIEGKGNARYLLLGTNSPEVLFNIKAIAVMPKQTEE